MYPDQAVYQASARESSREMPATFEEQPGDAALTERREAPLSKRKGLPHPDPR